MNEGDEPWVTSFDEALIVKSPGVEILRLEKVTSPLIVGEDELAPIIVPVSLSTRLIEKVPLDVSTTSFKSQTWTLTEKMSEVLLGYIKITVVNGKATISFKELIEKVCEPMISWQLAFIVLLPEVRKYIIKSPVPVIVIGEYPFIVLPADSVKVTGQGFKVWSPLESFIITVKVKSIYAVGDVGEWLTTTEEKAAVPVIVNEDDVPSV